MADFPPMQLTNEFEQVSNSDWVALAEKTLKGEPLESLVTTTVDGISIQPIYSALENIGRITSPGSDEWDVRALVMTSGLDPANKIALEGRPKGAPALLIDLISIGSSNLEQILEGIYPEMPTISLHPNPNGFEAGEKL